MDIELKKKKTKDEQLTKTISFRVKEDMFRDLEFVKMENKVGDMVREYLQMLIDKAKTQEKSAC